MGMQHTVDLDIEMTEVKNVDCTLKHEVAGVDLNIYIFETGRITVMGPAMKMSALDQNLKEKLMPEWSRTGNY